MTLSPAERHLLAEARRATLATIGPDGRARLVPICFVVDGDVLWTPLDEKPKAVGDVHDLARIRDIAARPDVTVLVDRWAEDWSELAWVRVHAKAALIQAGATPGHIVAALRDKYPQYRDHDLEHRPGLRLQVIAVTSWQASGP